MGKTNKSLGIKDKNLKERFLDAAGGNNLSNVLFDKVTKVIIKILEKLFIRKLITLHSRPKTTSNFHLKPSNTNSDSAILVQGPIDQSNDFTFQTLKMYRGLYSKSPIILSTWDDENKESIQNIKKLDVEVVLSKKPPSLTFGESAWKNVDLQIITAKTGISAIKKMGVDYCLKTRTDQRFYKPDLLSYFINLINTFPIEKELLQKKRLVASSFATPKYRIYGLTDMMMFGAIDDIENYWNVENYSSGIYSYCVDEEQDLPPIISGTLVGAEVYFMSSYLTRIGEKLDWNLDHYWSMLKKYFVIIDSPSLDFYWNKYNKESEYKFARTYSDHSHRLIDHMDWFQLYSENRISWDKIRKQEMWTRTKDGRLSRVII